MLWKMNSFQEKVPTHRRALSKSCPMKNKLPLPRNDCKNTARRFTTRFTMPRPSSERQSFVKEKIHSTSTQSRCFGTGDTTSKANTKCGKGKRKCSKLLEHRMRKSKRPRR